MTKRIDLRYLCYSFACFALLSVGVRLLNSWQVRREAHFILARAREVSGTGDRDKAINLYGQYLALDPRNIDAQSQYGTLLSDAGDYDDASHAFEAALRIDPGRADVRRKAVQAALANNRASDARDHLEHYLLKEFPDDAELLDLDGQCLAAAGDYLAAGRSLEGAIERNPRCVEAYMQLIAILSQHQNDADKDRDKWLAQLPRQQSTALAMDRDWAEKMASYWADRLVAANSQNPRALLFRGYRRYGMQSFGGAIEDAETALELNRDDTEALHLAALSCLAAKRIDKARDYAARGVKAAPKDSRMYDILAQIELVDRHADQAIRWLAMGVERDGPAKLWWKLGTLQIAEGRIAEAKRTAFGLRAKVFPKLKFQSSTTQVEPGLYADLLEAQIEQAEGHWREASQRFARIGPELKLVPELARDAFFALGNGYEQLAEPEDSLKAFRQAVDADPLWIPAREALAASLQSLGRVDEALEAERTLVALKDAPLSAWVTFIRWSIARTVRLAADKRDWSEVADSLVQLESLAPRSSALPLLRAELLVAKDRAADARKLIETERSNAPGEIVFAIALVDLAIRDKQWDQAGRTLEEAEKRFGDRAILRVARTRYLVGKGEKDAADRIRKLAEGSKEFSLQDQLELWRASSSVSAALGDFPEAERLCQLLAAQSPGDLRIRLELFDLAARSEDSKLMDTTLDEIRRLEGDGPIWHYATAFRLVTSTTDERSGPSASSAEDTEKVRAGEARRQAILLQASDHLAEALRLRPQWYRALVLEGLIDEEMHRQDAALAKYMEAFEQGENDPDVARRALRLLYDKGEYSDAHALLRRLEAQQVPFTTDLLREQSRVLGGLQDYTGALKSAERAANDSNDYRDYLWLGQLLGILGRPEEAERALQHACQLDERAPETWVALVRFFVRVGQKDRAEKALADAREKIPAAVAPLALADCLDALGKAEEAGRQSTLALSQKPDDPDLVRRTAIFYVRQGDLPKAADQFSKIVDGRVRGTARQVAEARGDLARVRADQGGYRNLLEAIRLVDRNLAAAPSSSDDLRLKGRLLTAYPQASKRREARAIFEELVDDSKHGVAQDRFQLARLCLAAGDWAKARRQMLTLLATQGDRAEYVATYAQALLDHKELDEALHWIDRLEEIAPDKLGTVQLRANAEFRRGATTEAIARLVNFLEKAPAGSADRQFRTLGAAAELEALASLMGEAEAKPVAAGTLEKAEELYRRLARENPGQGLLLVDFLGRQRRFDEALDLAVQSCKIAEAPQIAASLAVLSRQPGITPAQIERIAGILGDAVKKYGRAESLLLVMAQLREIQEKYAEAEALFREILGKNDSFVPALSDLANLLSLSGRQLDEAQDLIEKAITTAGPQASLLDTRASVYLALGQPEKALADLLEVVDQQPAPDRFFHLARVQQKLGRRAEAIDSLTKARAMNIRPESLHPLERQAYAELVRTLS